jgi:FdhE protein
MAYVALPAAGRAARLAAAEARWAQVLAARPDLAPAIELQRRLIGIVIGLADTIDHGRLPRLSLPPRYIAAKLARGVPALTGEPIPVPVALLKPALIRLCRELAAGGAGDSADHIRAAIEEVRMEAGSLLAASLTRDQEAIRTGAAHRGLAPDLVWLVAELAVSPFAHALQQMLLASHVPADAALSAALDRWQHGHCPACGSWPALAEASAGARVLRCSFCALAWSLDDYACAYCGNATDKFVTAAPDVARKDRRLELCSGCGGYLKTVDVQELSPFPLLAIADLETMDLDVAAMQQGFGRPPLRNLAAQKATR